MAVVGVLVGLAVLAAFAALHRYAWRRLVRDTTAGPGRARRAGTVVFVAGPLLAVAALVAGRAGVPFPLQRIIAWPGYLWLALSLYLLLALLVGELVRPLLGWWAGRKRSGGESARSAEDALVGRASVEPASVKPPSVGSTPSRRLFVSRIVGGGVAAATVGTVGYGAYGVLRGPKVKRVTVPLAKLPRGAHGFRIAVVSDVHLGPILGRGFTQRVVDTVNATQPDLIAVVGDLVDGSVEDLGPAAAPLAGLRSRHGAYFVTGNHEYFSGAEQWVDHVRELGLHPLRNARTELPGFDLAGVDDVAGEDEGEGPDFARALGDRDRSRASVLLAHQPVVIHDAVRHGVDLQLSGHTHGGQLWPGNLVAELANPTLAGLERYGDTQLYVSRGAGAWGPPVRVGAPSDITVVELASRDA
ncbi:metallophosphoesterase [Streptomyces sp. G44]|uniref:metallophosphoesterase n=1 Tax=Streptomyces sp. G44 TaxID=2807632 RepID=UPI0019608123|nr:metallophosphoesterase [Streptomyces sp. G44]MBM7172931.1 metallophosphoesterase [Streptomyces sp. G44]